MAYKKPLPRPNADNMPFWDGCKAHQLRFQKCSVCGYVRWPASILCPQCHSFDTQWIVASGQGKVYTFVVFHHVYHTAFEDEIPYVTAVIKLEEGPHLLSNIIDCDPNEVDCDIPVQVKWEDVSEGFSIPKFKLVR